MSPTNRLGLEKSPYLLQHAHNPVDWYPWGDEAFQKAVVEEKPVFLSIGYSTCHWCHVMEKESFEDQEIARMLNDVFVCIKVDREERPDIDGIYMTVCQMMTGSGGWPLTILLLPDKRPFYAATYVPKHAAFGRIGLMDLIPRIDMLWKTRRRDIEDSAGQALASMKNLLSMTGGKKGDLDAGTLRTAYRELEGRFDPLHGGFGGPPKFPSPHNLLFLLRYYHRTGQTKALAMVEKTLQSMRMGGIYDHLGYGFHRYSTDSSWLVPHFEKMLYDQALMAMAYAEAYQATGKPEYERVLREILTYVLRDMTSPQGAFYSAEDADSEGVEGRFYLWEEKEIRGLLEDEEARAAIEAFCIKREGNAAGLHDSPGQNILHLDHPLDEAAFRQGVPPDAFGRVLESGRQKLLAARAGRVRPLRDDKVLTDWNGLMVAALAKSGQILGEGSYVDAARKAIDFILNTLRLPSGRLLHCFREGHAAIDAHLDDYVFLVWALIELYEATLEARYLETALDLNEIQIDHFWDPDGGFFFTPDDGEPLLLRQKEIYDGAIPSGNSVAMLNLLRLSRMTGRQDLEEKSRQLAQAFSRKVDEYPTGCTQLLQGLDYALGPTYEVVLAGILGQQDMQDMVKALRNSYVPNKVVLYVPRPDDTGVMTRIAPFTSSYGALDGKATAYVCKGHECELPTTDIRRMIALLTTSVDGTSASP